MKLWPAIARLSTGREAVGGCKFTVDSEAASKEVTKQGGKEKVEP